MAKEEFVLFGSKDQTDVIWYDKDNNEFYVHKLILQMKSSIFRDLEWDEKKTIIKTEFSKEANLQFLQLLYTSTFTIQQDNLLEVYTMCMKYNVNEKRCFYTMRSLIISNKLPIDDEKSLNLIDIANFASTFKQPKLLTLLMPRIMKEGNLTKEQFRKINIGFKDVYLMELLKIEVVQKKIINKHGSVIGQGTTIVHYQTQIVEARDTENRYYLADVLNDDGSNLHVHYQGWEKNMMLGFQNIGHHQLEQD